MSDLVKQEPVLIGEIQVGPPSEKLIAVITAIPDRACGDCTHPAGVHEDDPPDPNLPMLGHCRADECRCNNSRLEAAGWTPPGGCAMGCR